MTWAKESWRMATSVLHSFNLQRAWGLCSWIWWAAEKKLAAFFMLAHNPELLACETKDWNCFMLLACWRRDITLRQIMIIILLLRSVMTQLTDWILTLLKNLFHYLAAFPTHCLIVFYNFTHCLTQLATRETIIPGVTSCLKRSNIRELKKRCLRYRVSIKIWDILHLLVSESTILLLILNVNCLKIFIYF